MLAINYPRTYAQTGEIAAYRPVRRPDRALPIQVTGGRVTLGGARLPLLVATLVESSSIGKVDAEIQATLKRLVSDGHNGVSLRAFNGRKWTESAWNWGVWKYDNTDPSYANRWELEEAALVQFDKTIAWALDLGLECVYLDFEGFDENLLRHPNQRTPGSYQGRGMKWSSEARQMNWDADSRIALRTSTVTGTRHIDNPRIIWKFRNEDGFSDWYNRSSTPAWGGGPAAGHFDKIVDEVTDSLGDNGYWNAELKAKLFAWRDANAPGWVIPAWGKGSTGVADGEVGFPKRSTWFNWATGADPAADRAYLIQFLAAMDYESTVDIIERLRAENPLCVINTGTTHYVSPECHYALPAGLRSNLYAVTHHYFYDDGGAGVKVGTAITRRSIADPTWSYSSNGGGWFEALAGVCSAEVAFLAEESGQYSPNRWRYQRIAYEVILACLHGHDIAEFSQSQQYLAGQYLCDGRYMGGDHAGAASPCARLTTRAMAPIHRYSMFSEHANEFVIQTTKASLAVYQNANKVVGIHSGVGAIGSVSDGSEHAVWSDKRLRWEVDLTNTATPTTDTTPVRVTDGTLNAGKYIRNTATEKIYYKRPEGIQFASPYCCGFIDTLREKAAADAIFEMPLYLSSMSASVNCALLVLRSDGRWPLFTGPMKLYIHGSDFSDEVVQQGQNVTAGTIEGVAAGAYGQATTDAFAPHNPPGAAYFMANDQVQVWYSGASSQSWGNNSGSASTVRLMMPEPFTLNLITPVDLEIFGVTKDGIPVRLASTYAGGIWSFNYTATYPEYTLQPAAARTTSARSARAGGSLAPSGGE